MVHNTATKVQAISNRQYIEFRREITYVLDKYELGIGDGGKDGESKWGKQENWIIVLFLNIHRKLTLLFFE